MATSSLALLDQTLPSPAAVAFGGSDRLSQEIFSILESNFLFGAQPEGPYSAGLVRVLSIDGGADGGALAAAALVRFERLLQELSGNPAARVADYFDLAAGSGAGGFLAAALFACRMPAEAARDVIAKNRKVFSGRHGRGGLFWRPEAVFKKVFGDLTVRDAAKPLLIPYYDMATAAPFVFSRADAVEAEAFDFPLWQVCAAACGVGPVEVASLDGRTRLRAPAATGWGGGSASAAVANPTAVAVTHVLHNKREFPFAASAGDLVVLSLGGSAGTSSLRSSSSSLLRIAGACQADMVDQAVSMAFGDSRATNYIRIQGNGIAPGATAEAALTERSVESVLFRGKKLMPQTNGERLHGVAEQLVREHHRRLESKTPVVLIKPSATPRTSSSSASTLITMSTNSSSESP